MSTTYILRDLHGHQMAETEAAHIERAMDYFESIGYPVNHLYTVGIKEREIRIPHIDDYDNWHPSYEFTKQVDMPVAGSLAGTTVNELTVLVEPDVIEAPLESVAIGPSGTYGNGDLRHSER